MDLKAVTIALLFTFFTSTSLVGQDCKKPENGKYEVELKTSGYEDYQLVIDNNKFIKTDKKGETSMGEIKWISNCLFTLNYYREKAKEDSASFNFKIHRGWGQQCYELSGKKSRIFRMTWTGNLGVTLCEGRFNKIRN